VTIVLGLKVGFIGVETDMVSLYAGSISEIVAWGLGGAHPVTILSISRIINRIHSLDFFRNIFY
jgi:hypothetical protein